MMPAVGKLRAFPAGRASQQRIHTSSASRQQSSSEQPPQTDGTIKEKTELAKRNRPPATVTGSPVLMQLLTIPVVVLVLVLQFYNVEKTAAESERKIAEQRRLLVEQCRLLDEQLKQLEMMEAEQKRLFDEQLKQIEPMEDENKQLFDSMIAQHNSQSVRNDTAGTSGREQQDA